MEVGEKEGGTKPGSGDTWEVLAIFVSGEPGGFMKRLVIKGALCIY